MGYDRWFISIPVSHVFHPPLFYAPSFSLAPVDLSRFSNHRTLHFVFPRQKSSKNRTEFRVLETSFEIVLLFRPIFSLLQSISFLPSCTVLRDMTCLFSTIHRAKKRKRCKHDYIISVLCVRIGRARAPCRKRNFQHFGSARLQTTDRIAVGNKGASSFTRFCIFLPFFFRKIRFIVRPVDNQCFAQHLSRGLRSDETNL